jgi:hypothetical protein
LLFNTGISTHLLNSAYFAFHLLPILSLEDPFSLAAVLASLTHEQPYKIYFIIRVHIYFFKQRSTSSKSKLPPPPALLQFLSSLVSF